MRLNIVRCLIALSKWYAQVNQGLLANAMNSAEINKWILHVTRSGLDCHEVRCLDLDCEVTDRQVRDDDTYLFWHSTSRWRWRVDSNEKLLLWATAVLLPGSSLPLGGEGVSTSNELHTGRTLSDSYWPKPNHLLLSKEWCSDGDTPREPCFYISNAVKWCRILSHRYFSSSAFQLCLPWTSLAGARCHWGSI